MSGTVAVRDRRTVAGEVVAFVDEPRRRNPWARQEPLGHPHPLATDAQTRQATLVDVWRADPGLRWLLYGAVTAVLLGARVPYWWLVDVVLVVVVPIWKDWRVWVPVFFAQMPDGRLWVREVDADA